MPFLTSRLHFVPVMVIALVGFATGCDSTEPAPRGAIQGTVAAEGEALVGVTVEVSGPSTHATVTDGAGRYAFEDLPSGAYVISIRNVPGDAAFPTTSTTAAVPEGGTLTVDFQGNFIRTASIMGTVRVREEGLAGVTVQLDGTESATAQTDSDGEFRFPALRAGSYTVELTDFPQTVDFPAPRTEVQLSTGQTHATTFEGIPELTASVVIQSISRRTASGQLEGVDPDDVHGRIVVTVSMDRGLDRPDSLVVLLAGEVVGRQFFQDSQASDREGSGRAAAQDLVFPINTAAFDPSTGTPQFLNGERALTVRLATREGGPSASTATIPLILRNADTFTAELESGAGPVLGQDGRQWIGGDLDVTLRPVVYTPDREVSTVQVELRRRGGSQIARGSGAGSAPFQITFSPGATGVSSLTGYQTPSGQIDQLRVITAGYSQGGSLSELPILIADSLRIDQVPPEATPFRLPTQGAASDCCRDSWIGETFLFRNALDATSDTGVGGVVSSFRAGAAGLSDQQLSATDPIQGGADLDESDQNTTYRALAVIADALGNERTIALESSAVNPAENERGAVFGVDRTAPLARLEEGSGGLSHRAVNPAPGSSWVLSALDDRSGIAGVPFRSVVERYTPSLGSDPLCIFPGGETCQPAPDGFVRALPEQGSGYFRLRAQAIDRAGNRGTPVEAWALRDVEAPQLVGLQLPSSVSGGSTMSVSGQASDDIDLHLASIGIRFGDPGSSAGILPFAPAEVLGTPFSESLTPDAAFQIDFPFVEGVELVDSAGAPSGAVELATQAVGTVVDVAGGRGIRAASLPGSPQFAARSFAVQERGAGAGIARWEMAAAGSRVCRPRDLPGDPGSCDESVPDVITLTASASGDGTSFEAPIVRVHFLAVVGADDIRWLGSTATNERVQDGSGADGRVIEWSFDWSPAPRIPAGTQRLIAVGVDADGAAIRSAELTSVEVVPAA